MINVVLIDGVGNRSLEAVGRYFRVQRNQRYRTVYQLVVVATHVGRRFVRELSCLHFRFASVQQVSKQCQFPRKHDFYMTVYIVINLLFLLRLHFVSFSETGCA